MNANIQQISELERVLSVKNATNWSFLSLFGKFALGGVLSRHSLDKKRGVDIVQLTLLLILFRINQTTVGSIYNDRFYDLLETGKNCYYRLTNRGEMNWRILLLSMACRFWAIMRKPHWIANATSLTIHRGKKRFHLNPSLTVKIIFHKFSGCFEDCQYPKCLIIRCSVF
ncbi:hypothetical protein J5A51_05205 [Prevotella fusca JCM 17724]|uniref:Uncharacterized protein n=1 Tax=Prevotella fusca JCM 17724 TaxID=1236517 RepID=A0A0K1NMD7_9BACT|nr:hypothetical protein [Prevotella fusca]AKU70033.1 hypothetical protein ADJ77_09380 [Prevotella fusca JCM 17724]QUB85641.1 hypothetical protein J5A51_05205 [Prevotella fusca JCM 17724]